MADARLFDFEALFAESAPEPRPRSTKANRYEFGIAYADPESIPLDGLLEAIDRGQKEAGRDLAKYPHPQGLASGRAYAMTGRHINVSDDEADLLRRAEEIQKNDLYILRLRT